ncbi:aspartyl/asparaginyl beta-hydroxylase domain-containing protein [Mucilaginibacter sp. P25]|uniref:aspartyl/asparaginyl beta-hydroxylase domain-containing protein n=1 Tax=Mucilaginibacter sp. P25 TaxID=3423945 RepID=UPI003D7BB17A
MENNKPAFYEPSDFDFIKDLEKSYEKIKEEFFSVISTDEYKEWPQKDIYNSGWDIFDFRFFKEDNNYALTKCPVSSAFIKQHNDLVITAGFSIMRPNAIIYPHVGYTDTVLRCHLGIKIPPGDCQIKVGGTSKKWTEGKALLFDDTFLHEAWNKTDETRIVMLIDLDKKLLLNSDQHQAISENKRF